MKLSHTIRPAFDDPNVVSDAGVVPALRLGEMDGGIAQLRLRPFQLVTLRFSH